MIICKKRSLSFRKFGIDSERSGIDIDPDDISPIYGVQERGILQDGFPVHVIGARFLSNRSLRPISQRVRGNLLLLFLFCH